MPSDTCSIAYRRLRGVQVQLAAPGWNAAPRSTLPTQRWLHQETSGNQLSLLMRNNIHCSM